MLRSCSPDTSVPSTGGLPIAGVPSDGVRVQMSTTTDQLRTHNLARTP
jgi:hypothetical protein